MLPFLARFAASLITVCISASASAAEKPAAPNPRAPDRTELWVPSKDLERILRGKKDAVLLTPDQYHALVRDAGRLDPKETAAEPPAGAVIESIRLTGKAADGAGSIALQGEITVKALAKGWSIAAVDLPWRSISRITADDGILFGESKSEQAKDKSASPPERIIILAKGPGERRVRFESTAALSRGSSPDERILFFRPTQSPATLALDLPAGSLISQGPARESNGDSHRFLLSGQPNGQAVIAWRQPPPAGMAARISGLSLRGSARFSESELTVSYDAALSSSATDAPAREITFAVSPANAAVIAVEGSEVESWSQNGSALTVRFTIESRSPQLRIELRQPVVLPEKNPLPLELPAVRLDASQQIPAAASLSFDEGVELLELSAARSPAATIAEWDAQKQQAVAVIRRALPRLVVDADARVFAARDFVEIDRSINLTSDRPLDHLSLRLPDGEEFMDITAATENTNALAQVASVAKQTEHDLIWKRAGQVIDLDWPQPLAPGKAQKLRVSSRIKLAGAAAISVSNIVIDSASKLAGYIALDSDPAWRLSVTEASGLEDRDARLAPVKGRMAWFNLRDFKLAFDAQRRDSVLDAEITAYALPRASSIEVEGQIALDISGAPLRQIEVRCAKESAKLLRFTSPLIGEQSLDENTGAWKITLAKETTGRANLRFRMSLAGQASSLPDQQAQDGQPGKLSRLSATLPRIDLPAARRFRGSWVVEANTDTQLSFDAKSLQPIDVMRVPAVEGYSPRHRLVAAYAYGTGEHSLGITATRHPHSELASLIVSRLAMTSALSEDGASRHEAVIELRHTGEQFVQASLPPGSQLLSAIVDGSAVKPVVVQSAAASASQADLRIALPLPGGSANRDTITARVLWEQPGEKWAAAGSRDLQPIAIIGSAPILATDWKVFAPEGYTFAKTDTTMEQSGTFEPEGIVGKLNPLNALVVPVFASSRKSAISASGPEVPSAQSSGAAPESETSSTRRGLEELEQKKAAYFDAAKDHERAKATGSYLADKLNRIIFPSIKFDGATIDEAIEFLRVKSRDLDPEPNSAKRGISVILRMGDTPINARITIDVSNISFAEALRFVTELAGMKYEIEPHAVVVTPLSVQSDTQYTRTFRVPPSFSKAVGSTGDAKSILQNAGISFPEGSSARLNVLAAQLVIKNTQANLDLIDAYFDTIRHSDGVDSIAEREIARRMARLEDQRPAPAKAGLLPLDLDLPASGQVLHFAGAQAPEALRLRYTSWERQMAWAVAMMAAGGLLFAAWGRQRPWLRSLLVLLLLALAVKIFAADWLPLANAAVLGWLAALVLWLVWRVFAGIEKRISQGGHRHAEA